LPRQRWTFSSGNPFMSIAILNEAIGDSDLVGKDRSLSGFTMYESWVTSRGILSSIFTFSG
jgi:hypothetical protein